MPFERVTATMPDVYGATSKQPQISDMFQKFALAFKAKTFEFFADEEQPSLAVDDSDGFALLDSAEEVITGQRVVVIKPDHARNAPGNAHPRVTALDSPPTDAVVGDSERSCGFSTEPPESKPEPSTAEKNKSQSPKLGQGCDVSSNSRKLRPAESTGSKVSDERIQRRGIDARVIEALISSVFATISSFEASYVQLQTAQVPFAEESVKACDKALVSHLSRLSDIKQFYRELRRDADLAAEFPVLSSLEAQVQENQSKLRVLGTISNRLQSEIDQKDNEVVSLRKKLGEIQKYNLKLSRTLSDRLSSSCEVSLCINVFNSALHDACRAAHRFTKILIGLMRKAGWNLNLAADSLYMNVEYIKKRHNCYAFLSYVCLVMFQGFDSEDFLLNDCNGDISNGHALSCAGSMKQLLEHVSGNPMEVLSMDPDSAFSRFCEKKYQELIHPSMESSVFSNLDGNEAVLNSWRSLTVFYRSFIEMASSIWTLHKLAFSFDPVVEIFQVERGVEYSLVYMEDVSKRCLAPGKGRPRVGFTVVPGFKIGKTVVQCKVYLSS